MTAAEAYWPYGGLTDRLRAYVKRHPPKQVRSHEEDCVDHLDDLIAEVAETEQDALSFRDAAHMLHEQAHGVTPWRSCQVEPCRSLALDVEDRGPAPLTLL